MKDKAIGSNCLKVVAVSAITFIPYKWDMMSQSESNPYSNTCWITWALLELKSSLSLSTSQKRCGEKSVIVYCDAFILVKSGESF